MSNALYPIVVVVFAAVVVVVGIKMRPSRAMRAADEQSPQWRLGNMAQQMGLQVLEGDPQTNLVYALGTHRMQKTPLSTTFGSHTTTTRLRMAGNPGGRPTDFVFFAETVSEWVGSGVSGSLASRMAHTTRFDCRLTVGVPVAVPPFEIHLRREIRGLETEPRLRLPVQSFGSSDLDSRLVLVAGDPRLGPALAPVAAGMAHFESLHILGQGTALYYLTNQNASSAALSRLPEAQRLLY